MRTVFTTAMALFVIGTLTAIVAPGFEVLLVGRIVQAIGTAFGVPRAYTTVNTLVPQTRRGSMMGFVTVATTAAPAAGPIISGLILARFDWHWLLILVLPIAVVALLARNALVRVPSTLRARRLDVFSAAQFALGFAGLVWPGSALIIFSQVLLLAFIV